MTSQPVCSYAADTDNLMLSNATMLIISRDGGSCSRLGAQFIIEAKTLGAQSHHFIY